MSSFDKMKRQEELIANGWVEVSDPTTFKVKLSDAQVSKLMEIMSTREFHVYDVDALEELLNPGAEEI